MLQVDNFSLVFLYLFTNAAIKLLSKPPESRQAIFLSVLSTRFLTESTNDLFIFIHSFSISISEKMTALSEMTSAHCAAKQGRLR